MTLSLTNPAHISQQDIKTLADYNPTAEYIAIEWNWGSSRIVNLYREEVNFFEVFLSYFYLGHLANKELRLNKIVKHLDQFNWSYAATQDTNSDLYRAYNTTCLLGRKSHAWRGSHDAWKPKDVEDAEWKAKMAKWNKV